MENIVATTPFSNIVGEWLSPESFENTQPRMKSIGCGVFPTAISRLVGEYLSDDNRDFVEALLVGVQLTSLCLSQEVDSKLASCWSMGFLPPERQWEPKGANIDHQFQFKDHEGCLRLLNESSLRYGRIVVDVLVVSLGMTSSDSPIAFNDLRNTIRKLQGHLTNVKHVVISITEYASCCFTLKDSTRKATGFSLPVNQEQVLLGIVDDLDTCLQKNDVSCAHSLFAFYFNCEVMPASEMYLAKFVISLDHHLSQVLFKSKVHNNLSNKIMWVHNLKSFDEIQRPEPDAHLSCHAFHVHLPNVGKNTPQRLIELTKTHICMEGNHLIERISFKSDDFIPTIQLPRPRESLPNTVFQSALIELTLDGFSLDLTHLNNGFFRNLKHLSVKRGRITGHLNSQCVPLLQTLRLESRNLSRHIIETEELVREHTQSLIHTGCSWQLVSSPYDNGWSLATYVKSAPNPQDDTKEGVACLPYSWLPVIRELMLVAYYQESFEEWQLHLSGDSPLKADDEDDSDYSLVWAPECVKKLTIFCTADRPARLKFVEVLPMRTHALSSLMCHNVDIELNGDVLTHLQSLKLSYSSGHLSGYFRQLELLSLVSGYLKKPRFLDAPLLQFFGLGGREESAYFSMRPQLPPHLSFLQITLREDVLYDSPQVLRDGNGAMALSCVNHAVLDIWTTFTPFFDQYQANNESCLELNVSALNLPAFFLNMLLQCETLKLSVLALSAKPSLLQKEPVKLLLPPLPRVKTLTLTELGCPVLLNTEFRELSECTVASPRSFGPKFKCPSLKSIRFTHKLSEREKDQCLNSATYMAMSAQPKMIYFEYDGEMHTMTWDEPPKERVVVSFSNPSPSDDNSSLSYY